MWDIMLSLNVFDDASIQKFAGGYLYWKKIIQKSW